MNIFVDYLFLNDDYNFGKLLHDFRKQLTSPEVESRSKGTQLLSEVLKRLPHDFLNESEGKFKYRTILIFPLMFRFIYLSYIYPRNQI